MDGRGLALGNIFVERFWLSVKHEDAYLKVYATMSELLIVLTEYFIFYNTERAHHLLDYSTPDVVHQAASGGGAQIVDIFSERENLAQEQIPETKPGQRRTAAYEMLPS